MATKTAAKLQISMSFRDSGYERGLRKARNETRSTQRSIQKMTPSLSGLGAAAAAAGVALAGMFATRALFRGAKAAVGLFQEQEDALAGLRAALDATGKTGVRSMNIITEAASELQKQTRAGDEALINATATLAQLAPALNAQELASAQKAIVGIADTFLKGNIDNAAVLVGKSIGSTTNALVRYGVQIDTAGTQSEKLAQLIATTGTFFSVSEAKAKTFSGQIEQLKNFFGDMGEVIGEALLPPLREFSRFLLESRDDIQQFATAFAEQVGNVSDVLKTLIQAASVDLGITFGAVGQLLGAKLGEGIFRGLQGVVRTFTGPIKDFLASAGLPGTGKFLLETLNPGLAALELAADAAGNSVRDAQAALDALAGASASGRAELARLTQQSMTLQQALSGDFGALGRLLSEGVTTTPTGTPPSVLSDSELAALRKQEAILANIALRQREINDALFRRRFIAPDFSDIGGQAFRGRTIAQLPELEPLRVPDDPLELGSRSEDIAGLTPDQVRRFVDGVPLDELTGKIKSFGMQTKELLFGVGEDMITGLIQGTLDMGDILKRFLIGFAARFILGPLSTALGIASPSKVFRGFGQDIGRGLAIGMDSMTATVRSSALRLAEAAIPVMPTPALALAGGGRAEAAAIEIRSETPPVNVYVNALFDPHTEARSPGGQAFHRDAATVARQSGYR